MTADWVRLEDVSFVRSRKLILDRIHWRISAGEHWAVLGANGSGKTTLLQLLAGYLWPTQGGVTVLGQKFGQVDRLVPAGANSPVAAAVGFYCERQVCIHRHLRET